MKPSCQQCTRAKKAEACEYDDGKGKTRTQILRETIIKLEQRVKELEDPEYISPSVTLFDPHFHSRSSSLSSSFGSSESSYLSTSHSPFPSGMFGAFPKLMNHLIPPFQILLLLPPLEHGLNSRQVFLFLFPWLYVLICRKAMPSPASFIPDVFFDEPQHLQPPLELAQMLYACHFLLSFTRRPHNPISQIGHFCSSQPSVWPRNSYGSP
jgi:hypothetical protein